MCQSKRIDHADTEGAVAAFREAVEGTGARIADESNIIASKGCIWAALRCGSEAVREAVHTLVDTFKHERGWVIQCTLI